MANSPAVLPRTYCPNETVSVSPRSNEGPLLTGGSDMYFAPSRPKDFLEIKKKSKECSGNRTCDSRGTSQSDAIPLHHAAYPKFFQLIKHITNFFINFFCGDFHNC